MTVENGSNMISCRSSSCRKVCGPFSCWIMLLSFLIAFAALLFLFGVNKLHNRLNFDAALRDIKFIGYIVTAFIIFGILTGLGLMVELHMWGYELHENQELLIVNLLVIITLAGFTGLCIMLGAIGSVLKRNCNDHYQLEKSHREIMEMLETIQRQ